jgi:hypothetical protein
MKLLAISPPVFFACLANSAPVNSRGMGAPAGKAGAPLQGRCPHLGAMSKIADPRVIQLEISRDSIEWKPEAFRELESVWGRTLLLYFR